MVPSDYRTLAAFRATRIGQNSLRWAEAHSPMRHERIISRTERVSFLSATAPVRLGAERA